MKAYVIAFPSNSFSSPTTQQLHEFPIRLQLQK